MTDHDIVAAYERLVAYLRDMHAAAGRSDWDTLSALELESRTVAHCLMAGDAHGPLADDEAQRKSALIREALTLDAAIRDLVEPRLRELDAFLGTRQRDRRVQAAYGVPHAP